MPRNYGHFTLLAPLDLLCPAEPWDHVSREPHPVPILFLCRGRNHWRTQLGVEGLGVFLGLVQVSLKIQRPQKQMAMGDQRGGRSDLLGGHSALHECVEDGMEITSDLHEDPVAINPSLQLRGRCQIAP